jgi:uncharacterized Zn finger protein
VGWGYSGYGFRPYVSAAQRRANALRKASELAEEGRVLSPVTVAGRKIAQSAWGLGWCEHLESFSDFSNRLPRGRTYVRNGSVMDLQIKPGRIEALVMGSELYTIKIGVVPLEEDRWRTLQKQCAGKIKSVLELLKGGVSAGVMEVMSHRQTGMFPAPREIKMQCSCPDAARLCKHLAAVLYGVGARLDRQPELLFTLRKVDPAELVAGATQALANPVPAGTDMDNAELADVFGIDLVEGIEAMPAGKGSATEGVKVGGRRSVAKHNGGATKPMKAKRTARASPKAHRKRRKPQLNPGRP